MTRSASSSASTTQLKEVPGVTTPMLVALGENDVKTVEDLAGCATDDLVGWTERKDGETKREPGFLDGFDISREDAEAIIMQARLKAGWVTEADLAPPPAAEAAAAERRRRRHNGAGQRPDAGSCDDTELDRGATRGLRRPSAPARSTASPSRSETDPLRGGARTARLCPTSSESCPGAASGSRQPATRKMQSKRKVFARGFKRDVRVAPTWGSNRPSDRKGRTRCLGNGGQGRRGRHRLFEGRSGVRRGRHPWR